MATPAEVVQAIIIKEGLGIWPGIRELPSHIIPQCFVASMPDDINLALCVYDVGGMLEGRSQWTGKTLQHPGVKILARAAVFTDSHIIYNVAALFDGIVNGYSLCVRGQYNAHVHSIYNTSTVIYIGEEKGTRRHEWSLNVRVVFKEPDQTPLEED